jgi:hypothetical protein
LDLQENRLMRTRSVLLIPAFIVACSDGPPTAPENAAVGARSAAAAITSTPARPFGGRCDTEITILEPLSGDPPNLLRLHIEYLCQLQHLGRTTAIAEQIVIFTSPTTATASNTTTYTAANGDQLFSRWTGTSTGAGSEITFSGPETFIGGTGRFADASGSSWISGTASFVTRTAQFTAEGTLSY